MIIMTRLVAAVLLVSAGAVAVAQPQTPTFRSEVDLVEIDATVTDAQGRIITDLTAADFEVLEDGRPQEIAAISLVNIPEARIERPLFAGAPIEPDVQANTGAEGRIYLIALDEVTGEQILRTRIFLRRFFEQHFSANDIAAVVWVGRGRASDTQDFTSNPRLLLNAVDRFQGGFSAEPPPVAGAAAGGGRPTAVEEFAARSRMRSLRSLTEFMASLRGRRKALLYFSTGLGFDMFDVTDYNGGVMSLATADAHAAMTAATRGNVTIYAIDPRGLSPDAAGGDVEAPISVDQRAALRDSRRDLRAFAELTGGFAFTDQNDVGAAFTRMVRENSTYYVLGFYSTNQRRDGRYRKLEVRVRRPGLQVRSRRGYIAPTGRAPEPAETRRATTLAPAVADALASPLRNPGVPMRVFAAPFKGADDEANIALAVELDPSALGLVEKAGTHAGEVEIAWTAIAAGGKVYPGERHRAALTLKPDTLERASREGFRVLSMLTLPAGRYQLRVAAGNTAGSAGSVMYDLEVQDFAEAPLSMSGVALTSTASGQALTQPLNDPLRDLLPGPVTARRDFDRGDRLALYTEIYEGRLRQQAHTVDITAALLADDGRVIRQVEEQRSSTELQGNAGGYGFRAELPLADLAPGLYVVRVDARANIGDRPVARKDIAIRVK
jgi:VWFA-related protein